MGAYDAVVVGSGPAGCTTAVLLGRAGLSVALLEAHRDPRHYKRLCTHLIQSSALPVLQRLGVDKAIEAAGGVPNRGNVWTRYGWVREPEPTNRPAHGYNLRREALDPIIREAAADQPGVDLVLGGKVRDLTRDRTTGRPSGVVAVVDGTEERIGARLVVGADGRYSTVAECAGLPARLSPNARFGYFAQYRNVVIPDGEPVQLWLRPPDATYTFSNEDDITVLATMPAKPRLPEFEEDRERALLEMFRDLPGGPDLSAAERVSDVMGTKDYPSITRRRVGAPGVALVGDAAMVGDPLWGVGCGFAFQSGEWLGDAVAGPLATGDDDQVDRAVRKYSRRHRRRLGPHQALLVEAGSARDFNLLERLLFSAGARNTRVADGVWAYGTRNRSPLSLFSPRLLARAALTRR